MSLEEIQQALLELNRLQTEARQNYMNRFFDKATTGTTRADVERESGLLQSKISGFWVTWSESQRSFVLVPKY